MRMTVILFGKSGRLTYLFLIFGSVFWPFYSFLHACFSPLLLVPAGRKAITLDVIYCVNCRRAGVARFSVVLQLVVVYLFLFDKKYKENIALNICILL